MNDTFLLFDLDGTISDPLPGIARSFNYSLSSYGHEELPLSALAQYIGPPLDESFRAAIGIADNDRINDFVGKFRERYADVGYSENTLYPGMGEILNALAKQSVPMAVCTSKRADFAEKILKLFGIRQYFAFISGGDVGLKKSQQIESLIANGSVDRNNCIMIGDRAIDLSAAHTNGMKSAGVLWGYGSRAELEAESPARLLSQPRDLLELV